MDVAASIVSSIVGSIVYSIVGIAVGNVDDVIGIFTVTGAVTPRAVILLRVVKSFQHVANRLIMLLGQYLCRCH